MIYQWLFELVAEKKGGVIKMAPFFFHQLFYSVAVALQSSIYLIYIRNATTYVVAFHVYIY